jgi:hypothetical protein
MVLSDGVIEGRRTFSNMLKYIVLSRGRRIGKGAAAVATESS